jgi:uncharacterized protein YbbK (DUF523 family)
MNGKKLQVLLERLDDERSKKVVFISHCLLNENVRYLGGAFRPGGVDEVVDELQRHGVGIHQMRCPEQRAWGGVLKRYGVPLYDSKGTALYRARRPLVRLFTYYSKARFWVAAREVVKDIQDYVRSGFDVVGIIGISGSPSCGVCWTLDLNRSVEILGACPVSGLDRDAFNEKVIAANLVAGAGLFIASIRSQLERKNLEVPFYEHDLVSEMRGQVAPPILPGPPSVRPRAEAGYCEIQTEAAKESLVQEDVVGAVPAAAKT